MPDITWNIKAKDETGSGFESFTRRLKNTEREARASGEKTFEQAIKSPEGLLRLAGVGLGGAIIQSVVSQLKAASEQIKNYATLTRTGTRAQQSEGFESLAEALPFGIGEAWGLGRNLRELGTGDEARLSYQENQAELTNSAESHRLEFVKAAIKDRNAMAEQIYQTEALVSAGGVQTIAAKIKDAQYRSDESLRAKKDEIIKGHTGAATDWEMKLANAKIVLRNYGVVSTAGGKIRMNKSPGFFGTSGDISLIEQAVKDRDSATAELAKLDKEKAGQMNQATLDRQRELSDQIAGFYQQAGLTARNNLAGIGGRLAGISQNPEGNALAYQIEQRQSIDDMRRELAALGPTGSDAMSALNQYQKLALSPSQIAIASGAGPGPLESPSFTGSLASGGGAALSQRAWSGKQFSPDQQEATQLLRQILQVLERGSPLDASKWSSN